MMKKIKFLLIIPVFFAGVIFFYHAYALSYTSNQKISIASPSTIFTINAGSFADFLKVNSGSIVIGMSSSTGGSFVLTSPSAITSSTFGIGGSDVQSCSGNTETDTITQLSGSATYTLIPTGISCGGGPAFTSPIVITSGGTYSGNWLSSDPNVPAVQIETDQPVVIQNSRVTGPGMLITGQGSTSGLHVTISNVIGQSLNPNVSGTTRGDFFYGDTINSIDIDHSTIIGTHGGIDLVNSPNAQYVHIVDNAGINLDDRQSNGNGGDSLTRSDLGHFILLNSLTAPNGGEIAWNQDINAPGTSSIEDIIDISNSGGSAGHPISIHDNYLEGATSQIGAEYTGGGITMDGTQNSTSSETRFISIVNNQMVRMQNNGIYLAVGHDILAASNTVISSGMINGVWMSPTDSVSYGYLLQNGYIPNATSDPTEYYNNIISNNYGGLVKRDLSGDAIRADVSMVGVSSTSNNLIEDNSFITPTSSASAVTPALEQAEYNKWLAKVSINNMNIGDYSAGTSTIPQSVSATAGNGQATISFSAPNVEAGDSVGLYTITSDPGNIIVTSTIAAPIIVSGLTNGIDYTFNVIATIIDTNGIANSLSSASNAVTPSVSITSPVTTLGVGGSYAGSVATGPTITLNSSSTTASNLTTSTLLAQLQYLEAELASLQAQEKGLPSTTLSSYLFTRNLSYGMVGSDVAELQQYLISENKGPAAEKLKIHGTTQNFASLTYQALVEFQKSVGITPASGYFGPITRAWVNERE